MVEIWKQVNIDNVKCNYELSNHGRLRNMKTNEIINFNIKDNEVIKHKFYIPGTKNAKTLSIHTLTATLFLDNPDNLECVQHKNDNIHDNRVENLAWIKRGDIMKKVVRISTGKSIDQYDKEGITFIKRFNSLRDASKELGISEKNFHAVLSGRTNTTGGFNFKYAPIDNVNSNNILQDFEELLQSSNYLIHRDGRVYNVKQRVFLEPKISNGFKEVYIDRQRQSIHKLLAMQFISNPSNKKFVGHKNGDKLDNNLGNLVWV